MGITERVESIQSGQTDYIYYNEMSEEYYEAGISKVQMKIQLRRVNPEKALIINPTCAGSMFCSRNQATINSLINNIEEDRIKEFRVVDKHHRRCYQLYFKDEPDCNHYIVIDYEGEKQ